MFVKKSEYEALKEENKELKSELNDKREEIYTLKNSSKTDDRWIEQLRSKDKKIEDLQREIDILYKHFKLDEEPDQEIKTAVRIDKRVHDLEMENLRLHSIFDNMSLISYNNMSLIGYNNLLLSCQSNPYIYYPYR